MIYLCPHPNCTASYDLETDDEGRAFRCDQCGAQLRFDSDGLAVVKESAPENEPRTPISSSLAAEKNPIAAISRDEHPVVRLLASWLLALMFTLGSFLVVLFFFLPLIDQTSMARQTARIDAGDREQARLEDRLWGRRRNPFDPRFDPRFDPKGLPAPIDPPPAPPNEDAKKKRKTERDEWNKTRDKLEDTLEETRGNFRTWMYVYSWGMLFGFLILGMASVGFLSYGPTTARRVVGGIVIAAEVLLIFAMYLIPFAAVRQMP